MTRRRIPRRTALALALGGAASAIGAPAIAQRARGPRVYMVTFRGWTDSDQGFKDYFERRRLPIDIVHRDVGGSTARLPDVVREIKSEKPDLVYAWGTGVALGIMGTAAAPDPARFVTDIPVVFLNVTDPVGSGIIRDLNPTRRNIAGSTFLAPVSSLLQALQSYRPVYRLGAIYNPSEANSVAIINEVRDQGKQANITLIERPVPLRGLEPDRDAVPRLLDELVAEGAQFLFMPPDSFLSRRVEQVTEEALNRKLPAFAAAEGTLGAGQALMGLISRYHSIGQLAGLQADQILFQGADPGSLPIGSLRRFSLVLRMAVARRLELYPPMLLLRVAESI
ncbi:MAG: ABC transporter substrate-binding protein [Alphaproteobacteria bacterium]|nr:ABC transporter substrate-binding protein [Alphaproteobacteria bacterium]